MSSVQQNVIKHKVGLLNLAAELGNVSRACKVMGFSRDTFYRYQSAMQSLRAGIRLFYLLASSPASHSGSFLRNYDDKANVIFAENALLRL